VLLSEVLFGELALRVRKALAYGAVVTICAIPVIGFARFAWQNVQNLSRFIPEERWAAYEWVRTNVPPRTTIAALNWNDIAFLGVYTNTNMASGYSDLSGRSPAEQLRNFVGVWKLLGFSREELRKLVADGIPALLRRHRGTDVRKPPFNTPDDYASAELVAGLLYWPYLSSVGPLRIASDHTTDFALVAYVERLFDETNSEQVWRDLNIEYVMLESSMACRANALPSGTLLSFGNADRLVYRLPSR
jgi:hypothetical protein